MKKLTPFTVLAALGLVLAGTQVLADDPADSAGKKAPKSEKSKGPGAIPPGQEVTPQGPGLGLGLGRQEKPARPDHPVFPEHPGRPAKPELPDDVKKLVDDFQKAREDYAAEQKELLKQIKGAAEVERETLREQLKTNREEWLAKQKDLRDEIRQRVKELRDQLPRHKELLDEAKEKTGERRKGP